MIRQVRHAWTKSYDPALNVSAGQKITPKALDPDNPGWRWCADAAGLGGWLPADIVTEDGHITEAFDTAELTVRPGDTVTTMAHRAGWTFCQTEDSRTGWLPDTCLAP